MLRRFKLLFSVLIIKILISVLMMCFCLLDKFVLLRMIAVMVFSLYDFLVVGCVEFRCDVRIVFVSVDNKFVREQIMILIWGILIFDISVVFLLLLMVYVWWLNGVLWRRIYRVRNVISIVMVGMGMLRKYLCLNN